MTINEEQYWKAIATIIEMEMVGLGMTQGQLAAHAGVGREALNAYLKGRREMKFHTFVRIADALAISPAELAKRAEARME